MHQEAFTFGSRMIKQVLPAPSSVIEFGSRNVNGSLRGLITIPAHKYVGIDLVEGAGVDEVADASTYEHDKVDLIICTEVLEHTPDGKGIIKNASNLLAPGGHLLLTCATDPRAPHSIDGYDDIGDEHYENVDPEELGRWLTSAGLNIIELEVHVWGDLYLLAEKPA